MKPRSWLRLPLPLLAAAAIATWAVPGSAAVTAPAAQHLTAPAAARAATPACNPIASSLRPAGPPQVTPGSFMATIRARGYLIAGVSQSTYHFGFLNPLDGKIEGFDVDMVHAIAKAIFGNPNKVVFKAISDDQRIPAIRSGAVDIVAHTMTINCERLKDVDFSSVYFEAGQQVLVLKNSRAKSLADLGGKKVCATAGSTSIANIKAARPRPIPVAAANFTDCLVLLQQGDVAAISTDNSILDGLKAQDPWTKIVGPVFTSEPYGLAISQQHPDFVRFATAGVPRSRTGRSRDAAGRWPGRTAQR